MAFEGCIQSVGTMFDILIQTFCGSSYAFEPYSCCTSSASSDAQDNIAFPQSIWTGLSNEVDGSDKS